MSETKDDVRVRRTKKSLRLGLMELLKEEPFEKISVKDICERTMINRMTFYAHYKDKYDLLDDAIKTLGQDIWKQSVKESVLDFRVDGPAVAAKVSANVIETCYNHRDEIFSITNSNNGLASQVLMTSITELVTKLFDSIEQHYHLRYDKGFMVSFLVGGYSGIVMHCLEQKSFDKAVVERTFYQVVNDALKGGVVTK